jgi:hypothetical protein
MKRIINHPGEALALIMASALCVSTPCLAAQTSPNAQQPGQQQPAQQPGQQQPAQQPGQQQPAQQPGQQQQAEQQQQPAQQANQTFTGKVIKLTTGKYALLTGQTPDGKAAGHFLDDQANAQKYEGKQVTVTGTFDEASNTIHVTNIQAA